MITPDAAAAAAATDATLLKMFYDSRIDCVDGKSLFIRLSACCICIL